MFERFTVSARAVVTEARAHARQQGVTYIGTEHVLLALLDPASGLASAVLRDAGVTADQVRAEIGRLTGIGNRITDEDAAVLQTIGIDLHAVLDRIEQVFGPDALKPAPTFGRGPLHRLLRHRPAPRGYRPIGFTARAKKVIELSLRESLALHHKYIGSEHILLGLLREGNGLAVRILTDAGLDLPELRRSILSALDVAA